MLLKSSSNIQPYWYIHPLKPSLISEIKCNVAVKHFALPTNKTGTKQANTEAVADDRLLLVSPLTRWPCSCPGLMSFSPKSCSYRQTLAKVTAVHIMPA